MKAPLHLLSAILLLAGGVLAGRAIPSSAGDAPGDTGAMVDRRSGDGITAERKHLARLRAALDRADSGKLLRPGMERLGIEELDALAREQMEKNRAAVAEAALAELYRREGADALERVSRWPDTFGAFSFVMLLHIAADWEAAMLYLEKAPGNMDHAWLSAALREAAGRNADDFLRAAALKAEGGLRDRVFPEDKSGGPMEFAPGFDFAKVHAEGGMEEGGKYFREWSYRQPDAAWDAMQGSVSGVDRRAAMTVAENLSSFMEGVILREGELEGMEWLGEKVAGLRPEDRAVIFETGMIFGNFVSGEGYARFCSRLEPAEVRSFIEAQLDISENVFYPTLARLPREELILYLSSTARRERPLGNVGRATASADHARLREHFSLTPEEIQRIRGVIPE